MKHERKLHAQNDHAGSRRPKRAMSVQQALEWAFRVECAQLELPVPTDADQAQGIGFGLEYVLMQRAALGCKVDGGQYKIGSYTHEDAEVIAAIVAGLPEGLGGKRMAIRVAELARAGLEPDWMPGAAPRCVPVETKRNQHGERATTIVVGTERVLSRGKWRTVEVLACPVTFTPHPQQIEAARRAYGDWVKALAWVKDGLQASGVMREVDPAKIASDKWHGRTVQRSDRGGASKPPLPIRRRVGGHAAPLCLALQPATPAISLAQQAALASDEGLVQT